MSKIDIYCVTNKKLDYLEDLNLILAGVGKNKFSKKYLNCNSGENINFKEENYSELTFHYWFWKNCLGSYKNSDWIGFCQKRRFWLNMNHTYKLGNFDDLKINILKEAPKDWDNYTSILCKPTDVSNPKKLNL